MTRNEHDLPDDEPAVAPQASARAEASEVAAADGSWQLALDRLDDALRRLADAAEQSTRTRESVTTTEPLLQRPMERPVVSDTPADERGLERTDDMVAALAAGGPSPPVPRISAPVSASATASSPASEADLGHSDSDSDSEPPLDAAAPPTPSRLAYALAVGAVVLGIVGTLYLVLSEPGKRPATWPHGYSSIARSVERTRDLGFATPVEVEVVPEDELARMVARDPLRRQYDRSPLAAHGVEFLRSLGLWEGELDALPRTVPGSVHRWAYYDVASDTLFVRERPTDAALRIAAAHELSIALDDQHRRIAALADDQVAAYHDLVQGEAGLAMADYIGSLEGDDNQAGALLAAPEPATMEGVPTAIVIERHAPSDLGPAVVAALESAPSGDERNRAFANLSARSKSLVSPLRFSIPRFRRA